MVMVKVTNKSTGFVLTMDEAGAKALAHRNDEFTFETLSNDETTTDTGTDDDANGSTDTGTDDDAKSTGGRNLRSQRGRNTDKN